ncbi:hypothetical protein [Paraflavitalea soli]|uniref:hypothetical protein n=1 Tax=Paraflavitalea soli TaxID=2315862 RepID=UPI0013C4BFAC|nr:hypothetical protein [Paraflavitalea soli]
MKYYLVARTISCMVGIEQCRIFVVRRSQCAAFERAFAGYILLVAATAQALPAAPVVTYEKASGPFHLYQPLSITQTQLKTQLQNTNTNTQKQHSRTTSTNTNTGANKKSGQIQTATNTNKSQPSSTKSL